MHTNVYHRLEVAIGVLVLFFIGAVACNTTTPGRTPTNADFHGVLAINASNGDIVQVRPLDEETNPFKGLYKPWDTWCYEHLTTPQAGVEEAPELTKEEAVAKALESIKGTANPSNWIKLRCEIDADGYMIPNEVSILSWENSVAIGAQDVFTALSTFVRAEGEIPPELRRAMDDATTAILFSYLPSIPSWLVADPPRAAMFLPNGDVITDGLLGSVDTNEVPHGCCGGSGDVYALYDAAGSLKRTTKRFWWYLYYDVDILGEPVGLLTPTADGYMKFISKSTNEVLRVWDYDGTRLDFVTELPSRDQRVFNFTRAKILCNLYKRTNDKR